MNKQNGTSFRKGFGLFKNLLKMVNINKFNISKKKKIR